MLLQEVAVFLFLKIKPTKSNAIARIPKQKSLLAAAIKCNVPHLTMSFELSQSEHVSQEGIGGDFHIKVTWVIVLPFGLLPLLELTNWYLLVYKPEKKNGIGRIGIC